ncbi:MAG: M48 family metallopeptidase [bacterium]|nr:M48 family metallopeptidase [bacterium]
MWEQIQANRRKSVVLVFASALLLAALGWALGEYFGGRGFGPYGIGFALIVWGIMTLVAWFQGDQVLLAVAGAKKIQKSDLPMLFNVVEEMTLASGLPKMPDVYVIDDPAPNAFAAGRRPDTAAVAVTSGLLKSLNRDELQGVIAHEMAHVKNRDVQLMLFAGVLAGAIVMLAEVGLRGMWFGGGRSRSRRDSGSDGSGIFAVLAIVLMILAPILAQLIYFAISRKREYLADASAAAFTRYPEGLASALEKIAASPRKLASANSATAPMYIINPLKRTKKMAANATGTHPPIDERVKVLRAMSGASFADYEASFRQVTGKKGVVPGSALADEEAGSAPRTRTEAPEDPLQRERARQVDDLFYKDKGWQRIACPCGTTLKLPPDFEARLARCPKCGREHPAG